MRRNRKERYEDTMEEKGTQKGTINAGNVLFYIWLGIWLAALVGSRLFLLFSDKIKVTDAAGYFESAMIQEKAMQPILGSVFALLYQNSLQVLFSFVGNRIEAVPVYHTVLQILALVFLTAGCRKLFGKMAAFAAGMALFLLPRLFFSIYEVSPENFYLFLISLLFAVLCLTVNKLLGKPVAELIVKKRDRKKEAAKEQIEITIEAEKTPEEMQEIKKEEQAGQEIKAEERTAEIRQEAKEEERTAEVIPETKKEELAAEVKQEKEEAVKAVTFLENPLPLPKKHVRRKMDFKIEAEESYLTEAEDDFDIQIKEGDDFDF